MLLGKYAQCVQIQEILCSVGSGGKCAVLSDALSQPVHTAAVCGSVEIKVYQFAVMEAVNAWSFSPVCRCV